MTESTIKDIRYDDILDGYKTEVKSQVQSGLTIVQYYYDQYKDGQMTENVSTIAQQITSTNEGISAFSLIEAGISETNEKIEKISEVISDTKYSGSRPAGNGFYPGAGKSYEFCRR